jgi:hypothetical protein
MATKIETLGIGLRIGVKYGTEGHVYVRRLAAGYQVVAAWSLPAINAEDPESVICGCALQGTSHAHAELTVTDAEQAEAAYIAGKACVSGRNVPTFAPAQRIGG